MSSQPAASTEAAQDHLHALLALAAHAPGPAEFARGVVPILLRRFASPCAALELRSPTRVVHERCSGEGADPAFWTEPVEHALTEAISESKPHVRVWKTKTGEVHVALVATPILDSKGASVGAVSVATPCTSRDEARLLGDELFALAALVGSCADSLQPAAMAATGAAPTPSRSADDARTAAQTLRKSADFGSSLELAFSLTNNLRSKTGCDRVALAVVDGTRVELRSISGLDSIRKDSPWVRALQAALEETLDHGHRLVCQRRAPDSEADDLSTGHRLHRAWHTAADGAAVASLPIAANGRIALVLGLQRAGNSPFRAEELDEIAKLVEPYAPALDLVERARAGLFAHALRSLREEGRLLRTSRGIVRAATVVAALAAVGWVAFGTKAWEVSVPCRVRSAELRHVGAPIEGVLVAATKRPGDAVHAGEVLARFDCRTLELESQRLGREIETATVEERRAFAAGTASDAEFARARLAELVARRAEVDGRIGRASIVAPFDGVVLAGDPAQRAGTVLTQGEELYQLAPDARLALELFVPEGRVDAAAVGCAARFSPFAAPESSQPLTLVRIAPASTVHEGRNVFVVEARCEDDSVGLRPGMEGVAVLEAGERRIAWVYGHQALDWLRLHVWP
ncbi:MAG: HlyD family efflux transporter periplasmic adaptor subunit [Planctomycetota bacterium]